MRGKVRQQAQAVQRKHKVGSSYTGLYLTNGPNSDICNLRRTINTRAFMNTHAHRDTHRRTHWTVKTQCVHTPGCQVCFSKSRAASLINDKVTV